MKHTSNILRGIVLTFSATLLLFSACAPKESAAKNTSETLEAKIAEQIAITEQAIETAKQTTGTGKPLMWVYGDDDTTVYLLGSFHMLPKSLNWRSYKMLKAFEAADTLVLEADIVSPDGVSAQLRAINTYGIYPQGQTLSGTLGPDLREKTDTYLREAYGVPLSALDNMKPWFAGISLAQLMAMDLKYDPSSGPDTYFGNRNGNRNFVALETADEVFSLLSSIPEDEQLDEFVLSVATLKESIPAMETLKDEWLDGDAAGLEAMLIDLLEPDSATYKVLLAERNHNWLPKLTGLLDAPGQKFVVVGAAHMLGQDSVITLLENEGITVSEFEH